MTDCPRCRAHLTASVCARCGLDSLGGAARELARLDGELAVLTERRARVLAGLGSVPVSGTPPGAPLSTAQLATGRPRRSAQQVLLVTGAVLLAAALLVFAGVAYSRLDTLGRAGLLALLTLLAGGTAAVLASRRLRATAEVAASLFVLLLLLDAFAARAVDLAGAGGTDLGWYASAALAVAGVLTLALRPTRLWTVRLTVPALVHAGLVVAVLTHAGSAAAAAVVLAVVAVLDAVLVRLRVEPYQLGGYGAVLAVTAASAAGVADHDGRLTAVLAYLLVAGAVVTADRGREVRSVIVPLTVAAVAQALLGPVLGVGGRALVVAVLALALVLAARLRTGVPAGAEQASYLLAGKALLLVLGAVGGPAVGAHLDGALTVVAALWLLAATAALLRPRQAARAVALGLVAAGLTQLPVSALVDGVAVLVLGVLAVAGTARDPQADAGVFGAGLGAALAGWWIVAVSQDLTTLELYTGPVAVVAAVAGTAVLRTGHGRRSPAALGPAVLFAAAPTLLFAVTDVDAHTTRLLVVLAAAVAGLLAGVATRLAGLLLHGATVAVVAAVVLVAPYAADVPRWVSLGAAGAVLVGLGATFEARRRDVATVRGTLAAWR